MNYSIKMIRRPSKNNGIRFCKYAVIVEKGTNKIVTDDWNYRYDRPDHLEIVKRFCKEINEVGDYEKWLESKMAKLGERR